MKRNFVVLAVVVVAVTVMLWVGFHGSRGGTIAAGSKARKLAPDFELVDLRTSRPVHLSDYRGKVVLLNFWATWCEPCKVEIPWFVDLQKQYASNGFTILGVAMDDAGRAAIVKFADDMRINYPILQGTDNVADAYGVGGFPTSVYIDRDGNIVHFVRGLASHREVEDNVKSSLRQQVAANSAPSAALVANGVH